MTSRAENFYRVWREKGRSAGYLYDKGQMPPEKLLQAIWQHQRLRRGELKTGDGRPVRVLHPGFISAEGGPDFRDAVLQIGDEAIVEGDVEIDLESAGWRAHGHDKNPRFKSVILHVVWDSPKPNPAVPAVMSLKNVLDAPLAELAQVLENESGLPDSLRGKCSAPLKELTASQLTELLHAAAKVRFQNKAKLMLARARICGWEQTLWEQLFRALGYKNNIWPMQNLAEKKPRWANETYSPFELQARLLGLSGLLPDDLTRAQRNADTFLRRAWDIWWRERDEFTDCILPRKLWRFSGLRPANHPQRRLALASHWLISRNFVPQIENWCVTQMPDKKWLSSLHEILQVRKDDFWSWHWTFKSLRLTKPQPLLGEARVIDLAVNIILPWLWIRAGEGGNFNLQQEIEQRFLAWPKAEDNSILKLARQRLLGTSHAGILSGAAAQQGLIQIVRDFCEHSNAICTDCRFPDLVRGWRTQAVT